MKSVKSIEIAKMIDHSLLRPNLTEADIIEGCKVAKKYNTASVCVKPCYLSLIANELKDTDIYLSTVIGFPHGSNLTKVKALEAHLAIEQGCQELDMVLNIGKLLDGEYDYVQSDIKTICDIAHESGAIVKVILENAYLTPELIKKGCELIEAAGGDFVKTSTGFAPSGAVLSDLRLMRATVSDKVRVKAAGGVRTLDAALKVKAVGCTRFGATATIPIMEEAYKREAAGTLYLPEEVGESL